MKGPPIVVPQEALDPPADRLVWFPQQLVEYWQWGLGPQGYEAKSDLLSIRFPSCSSYCFCAMAWVNPCHQILK